MTRRPERAEPPATGARRERRRLGLRARLILAAGYLLLVVLIALEIPLAASVRTQQIESFEATELGLAGLLASQISDPVAQAAGATTEPAHPGVNLIDPVQSVQAQLTTARILVIDSHRRVLVDTSNEFAIGTVLDLTGRPEFVSALAGRLDPPRQRFSDTLGEDLVLVAVPVFEGGHVVGAARLSATLGAVDASVRKTWIGLVLVGLTALLVGLGLAWFLATTLARPVRRLEGAAERLGAGDLAARAEPEGPAEVATLARSFNQMADAVSANLTAQTDFVANASHQLRTPLTGLRLRLEAIEAEGGPAAEQASKAQLEVDRLAALVQDLLELTRASSVQSAGAWVILADVTRDAVERWSQAADRAGITVEQRTMRSAVAWADPGDLEHALDNLIDNAIRYCPPGTAITVGSDARNGRGILTVTDDGPGIPPADRERVFERFYRGSTGRQSGAGTGLGLAIVAQLVRRWGGDVALAEGAGTRFEITLPPSPAVP